MTSFQTEENATSAGGIEAEKDYWRIVCISDTHFRYDGTIKNIPMGDILIHAGDFSNTGHYQEIKDFRAFMEAQPHPYKVFIAGNHDITIDKPFYISREGHGRFHGSMYKKGNGKINDMTAEEYSDLCISMLRNGTEEYIQQQQQQQRTEETIEANANINHNNHVHNVVQYIQDESFTVPAIESLPGLHIYGAPWQPTFCDWAFNVEIPNIKPHWDKIPSDVDLLITHGPPHRILDATADGYACGCPELKEQMNNKRIQPRVHIFGHIHEAYGAIEENGTVFANASTCTYRYRPMNPAIVIDIPYDRQQPARIVSVGENLDN